MPAQQEVTTIEPAKENLKTKAYQTIKDRILTCEYGPNMNLTEAFLLDDTGLSRAPIRDAISRLEQERLITVMPKKGMRVSDVEISDINTIYETRNLIEVFVIRRYGVSIGTRELLEIRQQFKSLQQAHAPGEPLTTAKRKEMYDLDNRFHDHIIKSSGNVYLIMAMEHINNQNTRLRALTAVDPQRLSESHEEHISIINQLLDNQYEAAAQAMEQHLTSFRNAAFEAIVKNGGWELPNKRGDQ